MERWGVVLRTGLGLLLFGVALAVLHHELRQYHYRDIVARLRTLSSWRIGLALLLTALNYLVLTGYDRLAFVFIRNPLRYRRVALASFIAYVFSHNIGLAFFGGSAVRLRLYSGWGLSVKEIAAVAGFTALTFWLGFLTLLGAALVAGSTALPAPIHLPLVSGQLVGALCLAVVAAYLLAVAVRRQPLRWRGTELPTPSLPVALAQVALSAADWMLAASVLFVLLPPLAGLSYPHFLGVFLLAQIAGVASSVPAGLGVFETVILLMLRPFAPSAVLLGSVLAYRIIYYLVPLLVGISLLATHEALLRRRHIARLGRFFGRWVPGIVPQVMSFTTFLGGVILLASGATPAAHGRLGWLQEILPLPVMEMSHFAGSLIGVGLLVLARGLQDRVDAAYVLTSFLLAFGAVFSLLKGADFEEAIILTVMLLALLPCRRHFYRRASILDEPLTAAWGTGVVIVLLGVGWLMLVSYNHVDYSNDLWWQFATSAEAPRSMRAAVGVIVFLAGFTVARMLRPGRPDPPEPIAEDIAHVRELAVQSPNTNAYLGLLGDKTFLFNQRRDALIMYGVAGRSWVAMGDPLGPAPEVRELVWQFHELSDRHGGWTVFYEVGPKYLPLYLDLGLNLLKLGEEGRVPLERFTLEGAAMKSLRQAHHRVARDGCEFEIVPVDGVAALLPELKAISDAWLAEKHTREKGFSLGAFDPAYLRLLPMAVARRHGRVLAFANVLLGSDEMSIDLMRHRAEAPSGVMDYMFVELILWGREHGYRWFNLGMAPFSGLEDRTLAPLWGRLGAFVFRHAEHFYNFRGLRQYKEKFNPEWQPHYLASPGGLALPRILANIAALISSGYRGIVSK